MINNDLMSLLEYGFTSLLSCKNTFGIIHFIIFNTLRNYNIADIDHVIITKSCIYLAPKRGGIIGQSDLKHASVYGDWTPLYPYWSIGSNIRKYKETHTRHAKQYNLMRVTWTSAPSQKKASPLIASLSVLSIKFHLIKLIRYWSWLLVLGYHS